MSQKNQDGVCEKLFYSIVDFACESEPSLFAAVLGETRYGDVFDDADLVESCISLLNNDLNVSLAAQKLYMHRNTLIYRIKKIKRLIGLDVTAFSDAVHFIILLRAYNNSRIKSCV